MLQVGSEGPHIVRGIELAQILLEYRFVEFLGARHIVHVNLKPADRVCHDNPRSINR